MKCTDSEMTEAEVEAAAPSHLAELNSDPCTVFRNMISMARKLIDQGKPSQALQAVVTAIKIQGGNEAASLVLDRTKELFLNKIRSSADAAELSSLFAEFSIADAIPQGVSPEYKMDAHSTEPDSHGTSILAESGRVQVVVDAFSDGSSFICLQCGGLVSNQRKEEHLAFWCGKM